MALTLTYWAFNKVTSLLSISPMAPFINRHQTYFCQGKHYVRNTSTTLRDKSTGELQGSEPKAPFPHRHIFHQYYRLVYLRPRAASIWKNKKKQKEKKLSTQRNGIMKSALCIHGSWRSALSGPHDVFQLRDAQGLCCVWWVAAPTTGRENVTLCHLSVVKCERQ